MSTFLDTLFVVEGTIEHFQWAEGHENLLEQIQQRARGKSALAGAAAAAMGQYGTLATSAMVAAYDGEYTENFACVIEGRIVCGRFVGARKLQNGDWVRAVVLHEEGEDVLYAHAVQRPKDETLWLPNQVYCGDGAAARYAFNLKKNVVIFTLVLLAIMGAFILPVAEWDLLFYWLVIMAVMGTLMIFGMEGLFGRAAKEYGELGSRIFTLLEFPDPDNLDMLDASMQFQTEESYVKSIYLYPLALDAHASGQKIKTIYERKNEERLKNLREREEAAKKKKQREKRKKLGAK